MCNRFEWLGTPSIGGWRLLAAGLLVAAFTAGPARAVEPTGDAPGEPASQVADETRKLSLNYRRVPLERVLDVISRSSGKNT